MNGARRALAAPILVALCVAPVWCDRGESTAHATRSGADSTSVPVVALPAGEWPAGAGWSLGAEPILAIGVVEGAPAYEFAGVTAGIRLDDGTIVVADLASKEIRFFDARGVHLRSTGRKGGGPGEYTHPQLIARYGADSLLVWDAMLSRGTLLSRGGTFTRTVERPDAASARATGSPVTMGIA